MSRRWELRITVTNNSTEVFVGLWWIVLALVALVAAVVLA